MTNIATYNFNSLDFNRVSGEVRSLVIRRRELMMFLGSLFVALSIYLDNLLHGSLPLSLVTLGQHVFFTYSLMLLLPSILIALRIMKLHGGMTINGIFYHHIILLITLFWRNHQQSSQFALSKITQVTIDPFNNEELENHLSQSLQDTNQDMNGITAFVRLWRQHK